MSIAFCGECYYWRTKGTWVVLAACFEGCGCLPAPVPSPGTVIPEDYIEIMPCVLSTPEPTPPKRQGFVSPSDPEAVATSACVISRTGEQTWFYAQDTPPVRRVPAVEVDENYLSEQSAVLGNRFDGSKDMVLVFGEIDGQRDQLIAVGQVDPAADSD